MTLQEAKANLAPEALPAEPGRARSAIHAGARAGTVGACVGIVVSILEQVAVRIWGDPHQTLPNLTDRTLGFFLTVSFFGVIAFLLGALGWLGGSLKSRRVARVTKIAAVTFGISVITLFHGFALGLRLMLGSSLTVSGAQFFLNSTDHLLGAIFRQYLGYLGGLAAAAVAIAIAVGLVVRHASKAPVTVRRVELYSSFGMTTLAVVAVAAPLPSNLAKSAAKTNPEAALLASGASNRAERFPGQQFGELTTSALASPKLPTVEGWAAGIEDVEERPNIVMITLETVGANHVGFLGYPRTVTPNLDRISKRSVVFTHAYSTATHSNYAQMAVLSSLFPRRGGDLDMYERLDYPRFLMHDLAYQLGYTTATISSQDESWQGMDRFQKTETPTYFKHAPDYEGEHLDLITENIAPDEGTVTKAIEWIDTTAGKPFSLYVNLQSTHFPYPIPKAAPHPFSPSEPKGTFTYVKWERGELQTIVNRYDNALHYVDIQIGRLYDALAQRGVLDNTIFVVTADHGENFFDHDYVTHGRTLYEEEARVPLLFHYPRWLEPRTIDEPVSSLDATPTVVDLLGLDPHPGLQGETIAWEGLAGTEHQAAVFMNIQGWKHYDGIVCMPYKLVFDPDTDESVLFDLTSDPHENNDIAKRHPDVAVALERVLMAQIEAQERYYADDDAGKLLRADRYPPVMLACPAVGVDAPPP